jgi:hypothetical protein
MKPHDPWRPETAGPWPLLAAASSDVASQARQRSAEWTWFAEDGVPKALPLICPHRGMPLAGCRIEDGRAVCPYHGMRLAPVEGRPMFRFKAMDWTGERNRGIAFLESQARSQPWVREVFRIRGRTEAPALLCLENFLDATHTPQVHPGMVRRAGHEAWIKARGTAHEWGFQIEYPEEKTQSGWLGRLAEPARLTSFGRYLHPFAAQVDYVGLDGRTYFRATAYLNPVEGGTELVAVVESRLWRMGLGPLRPLRGLTRRLFRQVLRQDIDVLDRTWQGITRHGLGPADLVCRSEDLAWPWLLAWTSGHPPDPGTTFEGAVRA